MKRGKKYQEALKLIDRTQKYPLTEALELLKKVSYAKFDATVEIAFRLNIDPRKADQNLRGAISLPNGTGRTVRVLVIAKDAKAKEALAAGADYAGDVEYLEKIKAHVCHSVLKNVAIELIVFVSTLIDVAVHHS